MYVNSHVGSVPWQDELLKINNLVAPTSDIRLYILIDKLGHHCVIFITRGRATPKISGTFASKLKFFI